MDAHYGARSPSRREAAPRAVIGVTTRSPTKDVHDASSPRETTPALRPARWRDLRSGAHRRRRTGRGHSRCAVRRQRGNHDLHVRVHGRRADVRRPGVRHIGERGHDRSPRRKRLRRPRGRRAWRHRGAQRLSGHGRAGSLRRGRGRWRERVRSRRFGRRGLQRRRERRRDRDRLQCWRRRGVGCPAGVTRRGRLAQQSRARRRRRGWRRIAPERCAPPLHRRGGRGRRRGGRQRLQRRRACAGDGSAASRGHRRSARFGRRRRCWRGWERPDAVAGRRVGHARSRWRQLRGRWRRWRRWWLLRRRGGRGRARIRRLGCQRLLLRRDRHAGRWRRRFVVRTGRHDGRQLGRCVRHHRVRDADAGCADRRRRSCG